MYAAILAFISALAGDVGITLYGMPAYVAGGMFLAATAAGFGIDELLFCDRAINV